MPTTNSANPLPSRGRFQTNIPELDALLGGAGIPSGSVVLISGEPGTGKTTLAWEMIRKCSAPGRIAFLSCDELADMAYQNYLESYAPKEIQDKYSENTLHLFDICEDTESAQLVSGDRVPNPDGPSARPTSDHREGRRPCIVQFRFAHGVNNAPGLGGTIKECVEQCKATLIVIDGLNSLIDIATKQAGRPGESGIRAILRAMKADLRTLQEPAIAIITCEGRDDRTDRLYESYLADVQIELRREEVTPDPRRPEFIESILTCSVPKGRGMRVQRRRICYDFTKGNPAPAIAFYETYPADGLLSLFHENAPQRTAIDVFKTIDVPTLYPNLSVRDFDLSNMYHEYAIRRRGRQIPSRRPLMVMNVDEYWVRVLHENGILEELRRGSFRVYGDQNGKFIDEIPLRPFSENSNVRSVAAVPHFANVSMFVLRRPVVEPYLGPGPYDQLTLVDIENMCVSLKKAGAIEFPLRIEMKHVDTCSSTLLELITAHGGDTSTKVGNENRLEFVNPAGLDKAGKAMFVRLHRWIHRDRIVRPIGTIDPAHPTNKYEGKPTWAVARHWYSSLINNLLCPPSDRIPTRDIPRVRDVAVVPIPAAGPNQGRACCMWGEWYLAVESGAENMALAYAVIENFLSPSKMITHAITGAGLPVCDEFFKEFGSVRCTGVDLTYQELRKKFFHLGIRRSDIAEYRTIMQKLYAAGLQVAQDPHCDPATVWGAFRASVEGAGN